MESLLQNTGAAINSAPVINLPVIIPGDFIEKILIPYKENVKYLKSATILHYYDPDMDDTRQVHDLVTIEGKFSIPDSCYIDNTGHFNAVEFNICYNQLAYVLFAKCIREGILQKLVPDWDEKVNMSFDSFIEHQLSSMLIVKIEGNFVRPINSEAFSATLTINRILWACDTPFVHTKIAFTDLHDGKSHGSVLLAFSKVSVH
jgi:(3R)-3-[(carboxylmethyl)amino]fatty acid synthase